RQDPARPRAAEAVRGPRAPERLQARELHDQHGDLLMRPATLSALAALGLAALFLGAGVSSARPVAPCGSTGPSAGTPSAQPLGATASAPKTVDQRHTPKLVPGHGV